MTSHNHESGVEGTGCPACYAEVANVSIAVAPDEVKELEPHAFEIECWYDGMKKPFDITPEGGGTLHLIFGPQSYDNVVSMFKATKGRQMRVLIEILEKPAPFIAARKRTKHNGD